MTKKNFCPLSWNYLYADHFYIIFASIINLGNVLASEVEEARMLVDTAERAKKNADNEVSCYLI